MRWVSGSNTCRMSERPTRTASPMMRSTPQSSFSRIAAAPAEIGGIGDQRDEQHDGEAHQLVAGLDGNPYRRHEEAKKTDREERHETPLPDLEIAFRRLREYLHEKHLLRSKRNTAIGRVGFEGVSKRSQNVLNGT